MFTPVCVFHCGDKRSGGGVRAQVPASGTYRIKSASGTYVEVKGKYYAKPDASTTNEYTQIGVGIGYKTGDGYRVYSLSGKNPKDNSSIEVYNYVDKAYKIVSEFAQTELNKKLGSLLSSQGGSTDSDVKAQLLPALNAMADSICKIYTDDYAFMTLVPQAHYGNKWIVRAKATVPAIPYTIQAVGNYIVVGNDVRGNGYKSKDVWDWAKQHVLKYLDEHQTDASLKALVTKYLDQVNPGTTYYLTYESKDNSFGYETKPTDNSLWTMEEVSTTADGLTPGVVNIKNNSTDHYVNVTGKYEAEPDLTLSDIESNATYQKNAAITLNFGRYDRSNDKLYRITELSNQGQDVVGYLAKGMDKVFTVLDSKLSTKDSKNKTAYDKITEYLNGLLTSKSLNKITAENVRADVKTAVDLCADHYAYMKLIDNGDGSVKLRTDVPEVPALLDLAVEMYQQYKTKGDWAVSDEELTEQGAKGNAGASLLRRANSNGTSAFEEFAKDQITKYFESSQTTEALKKLWRQNKDKWHFGKVYYLSAESSYNTFEFTEDGNDAAALWTLAKATTTKISVPQGGYYRIKNVGGFGDQRYIEVRGRATADVAATNKDKVTKPGTILYVNLNAAPTEISSPYKQGETVKAYELMNVRSQGIDVMNGCEATTDELKNMFDLPKNLVDLLNFSKTLQGAYNGYIGFGRMLLSMGASLADDIIGQTITDATQKSKFDALMADFNANYLPSLKFQVYLIPVDGQKDTYLVRSMVPSVKPIVDFYKANKTDMDAVVVPAVRNFLNTNSGYTSKIGFTGEKFTADDDAIINTWYSADGGEWHVKNVCEKNADGTLKGSGTDADPWTLSYSTILGSEQIMFDWLKLQMMKALKATGRDHTLGGYVNMIHYKTPYYLIEGDNHDAAGNRVYTGNAELGFANDGLNAGTAFGGSLHDDLTNAKEHAYWTLEPVDETNFFTVKPNSHPGKNGKYYASTYLDFPFQTKGNNVSAVYTLNADGVKEGKDAEGNAIKYVTFDKATGVIPAATPVIIEYNSNAVNSDLALEPVLDGSRNTTQSDLIQGTFFGGKHNVNYPEVGSGLMSKAYAAIKGNIDDKFGTTTMSKNLYLFGYNAEEKHNPYGFWLYSAHNADDTTISNNNIPANKPFLLQDPEMNAKIYVMFGDEEATGIEHVINNGNTTIPAHAPRYNLSGQRVDETYKGIVIVNGHKYVQK